MMAFSSFFQMNSPGAEHAGIYQNRTFSLELGNGVIKLQRRNWRLRENIGLYDYGSLYGPPSVYKMPWQR